MFKKNILKKKNITIFKNRLKITKIKSKDYHIKYNIKKINGIKTLNILWLENKTRPNLTEFLKIISNFKKIAKEQNCLEISCRTWIFAQRPFLAKKLGFVPKSQKQVEIFNNIIKKNNAKKVLGIWGFDKETTSKSKRVIFQLETIDNNNKHKIVNLIHDNKAIEFPTFVCKLN